MKRETEDRLMDALEGIENELGEIGVTLGAIRDYLVEKPDNDK
jgi:hypothetical protein